MINSQIQELINAGALVVCDHSAGKDSQAQFAYLKTIVPRDQLIVVHAHLPGVEWDGVIEHIIATTDGYEFHQVVSDVTFLQMVESRGMFPSAQFRKCTSKLKMDPIDKWIRKICKERGIDNVINCMGIRAQESHNRAKKTPFKLNDRLSKSGRKVFDWYPIFEWDIEQVWQTIRDAGQEPHIAYKNGMSRLSCCFCIMASKRDLQTAARLNPTLLKIYADLERKIGHTLIPPAKGKDPVYLDDYINS